VPGSGFYFLIIINDVAIPVLTHSVPGFQASIFAVLLGCNLCVNS
jgi:hypothetical protein